jgi:tetratricopeptide (TPR) repeat protein
MKKLFSVVAVTLMLGGAALAQSTDAGIALNNYKKAVMSGDAEAASKQLNEAKDYIDKAMASETEMAKPKTWYYAGEIYTSLVSFAKLRNGEDLQTAMMAMMQKPDQVDPAKGKEIMELLLTDPNFDKGLDYFKKHIDMPKKAKDDYSEEIKASLGQGTMIFIMMGNGALQKQEYEMATKAYVKATKIMAMTGVVDYAVQFNAGVSAENAKDWSTAVDMFKTCASNNYEPAVSYGRWAKCLINLEKKDEAFKVLDEGRAKHGGSKEFALEEANIYIATGDLPKAEAALNTLIQNDPKNPLLHFNVGVIYDNTQQYDKAEAAYNKALEIDASYFDANYNMGAMFYNQGVDYFKKIQDIDDMAVYAKEEKVAKELFQKGLPYMEKARAIMPDDKNTLNILKSMYLRLGMNEKAKEVSDQLKN